MRVALQLTLAAAPPERPPTHAWLPPALCASLGLRAPLGRSASDADSATDADADADADAEAEAVADADADADADAHAEAVADADADAGAAGAAGSAGAAPPSGPPSGPSCACAVGAAFHSPPEDGWTRWPIAALLRAAAASAGELVVVE